MSITEVRSPELIKAQERALANAGQAGKDKRKRFIAELKEINRYHLDGILINDDSVLEELANCAERLEAIKCLNDKILGRNNDRQSRKRGLVAIVTDLAKNQIEREYAGSDPENDLTVPRLELVDRLRSGQDLYQMRLTMGGFRDEGQHMGIAFSDFVMYSRHEGEDVLVPAGPLHRFYIELGNVVNIAGSDGEYWQNPKVLTDEVVRLNLDV
ncbi:MAG: hypothetical protein WDN66_05030 [Candidatus Saccharibacteria bacterium]